MRMAQQIMRRGRGLQRILQELRVKGYGERALAAVKEAMAQEDFGALCIRVARKKSPFPPEDMKQRQKLAAYLMRSGFGSEEVREALRSAWKADI